MNEVEAIIVLLLLFMAVPDICKKLRKPALVYSAYVVFGIAMVPWLDASVMTMLKEAGSVGFLLLLFEVGMEIELPRIGRLIRPARDAIMLALLQVPIVLAATHVAGFELTFSLMAAAALTGCSVGMAHAAWKVYPGLTDVVRKRILRTMVALELWSILTLILGSAILKGGIFATSEPDILGFDIHFVLTLLAILATVFLIAQYGSKLVPVFEWIIARATHWRVHLLVLLVLIVCTIGERIGLGGPKTAFFLGLAMNHTRHRGVNLDEYMAPISQRFLIPIFFVALGLQIQWENVVNLPELLAMAIGTAGLLLGTRMVLTNRMLKFGGDKNAFLLLSPNLTMVALGATALLEYTGAEEAATWLLLTGLFMTIPAILLLPASNDEKPRKQTPADARARIPETSASVKSPSTLSPAPAENPTPNASA